MRNRVWVCCMHDLRRLISTPRAWAVLILSVLILENQFAPVRALLSQEGLRVSFPGMLLYLFNDPAVTLLTALMLLMLLFDVPMTDETQRYIITRTGRGAWAKGHVCYILLATALYVLLLALIVLCLALPWADFSGAWGTGLEAFVLGGMYEVYDSMLNYDPWLMRAYTPLTGALVTMSLHYLGFAMMALTMCAVNLGFRTRMGFLAAAIPAILDSVADEYFSAEALWYLPLSLSRPSALDYGDQMGRPPLWYAWLALTALVIVLMLLVVRLCRRRELGL